MKTIYFMYCERHGEFEGVFDENGNILGGWYSNDANWRNGYFAPFMKNLGFNCLPLQPEQKPFWYRRLVRALDIDFRMY